MMSKEYRIIEFLGKQSNERYMPQEKGWWFWYNIREYHITLESAEDIIKLKKVNDAHERSKKGKYIVVKYWGSKE